MYLSIDLCLGISVIIHTLSKSKEDVSHFLFFYFFDAFPIFFKLNKATKKCRLMSRAPFLEVLRPSFQHGGWGGSPQQQTLDSSSVSKSTTQF